MIEQMRRTVAKDLAQEYGLDYDETLAWMQDVGVFGNWSEEELRCRPVNLDELADLLTWDGWNNPAKKISMEV